jgi:hypothetical protein
LKRGAIKEKRVSLHPGKRNENIEEGLEKYSCFYKQDHAGKENDANKIDPDGDPRICGNNKKDLGRKM